MYFIEKQERTVYNQNYKKQIRIKVEGGQRMKKILKKVAATILAASMVIGMTACGTGGGGSSTQQEGKFLVSILKFAKRVFQRRTRVDLSRRDHRVAHHVTDRVGLFQ